MMHRVAGVMTAVLLVAAPAVAAPTLVAYRGRLLDADGQAVPDGRYAMRFVVYDREEAGADEVGHALRSPQSRVEVIGGDFEVLLDFASLPDALLGAPEWWLETWVRDEQIPGRLQIPAVPAALSCWRAEESGDAQRWGGATLEQLADGDPRTATVSWGDISGAPVLELPDYHAGAGIEISDDGAIAVRPELFQRRVLGRCADGEYLVSVTAQGALECRPLPMIEAGGGLCLRGGRLSLCIESDGAPGQASDPLPWDALRDIPREFPPAPHAHRSEDIEDFAPAARAAVDPEAMRASIVAQMEARLRDGDSDTAPVRWADIQHVHPALIPGADDCIEGAVLRWRAGRLACECPPDTERVTAGTRIDGRILSADACLVAAPEIEDTLVLDVPADYASVQLALESIAARRIAPGAAVIIQIADGSYEQTSSIRPVHPDGERIAVFGNLAFPDAVELRVEGADGLLVGAGHRLSRIAGLRIVGDGTPGTVGIRTQDGATLSCDRISVEGFPAGGFVAEAGATMRLQDTHASRSGAFAYAARSGGRMWAANADAATSEIGFLAERGAMLDLEFAVARDNSHAGYLARFQGHIEAPGAQSLRNPRGFVAEAGATLQMIGASVVSASVVGVRATMGATVVADEVTVTGAGPTARAFEASLASTLRAHAAQAEATRSGFVAASAAVVDATSATGRALSQLGFGAETLGLVLADDTQLENSEAAVAYDDLSSARQPSYVSGENAGAGLRTALEMSVVAGRCESRDFSLVQIRGDEGADASCAQRATGSRCADVWGVAITDDRAGTMRVEHGDCDAVGARTPGLRYWACCR